MVIKLLLQAPMRLTLQLFINGAILLSVFIMHVHRLVYRENSQAWSSFDVVIELLYWKIFQLFNNALVFEKFGNFN